jgi:hypothetical protein
MDPSKIKGFSRKTAEEERAEKVKAKLTKYLGHYLKRSSMPTFQMYSKLDKNLLKQMLIRVTEI